MDQKALQFAIDAIWNESGPQEYGCLIEVGSYAIFVTIAGEYKGNTYYLADMINTVESSQPVAYVEELKKIVESALIDIYKFQIMSDLELLDQS